MTTPDQPPKSRSTRFAELGPVWITAIATLVAALTAAGFFAGRVSAPQADDGSAAAASTTTVTVTATAAPPSGTAATSGKAPTNAQTPPGAYWAGTIQVIDICVELDARPAIEGPGNGKADICANDDVLSVNSRYGAKIVALPAGSSFDKDTCRSLVTAADPKVADAIPTPTTPGRYCFSTTEKQIVTMDLVEHTSYGYDATVTVWPAA